MHVIYPTIYFFSPRQLRVPGHDLANVHTLREVADAHAVAAAGDQKDVVLIGSSFIGNFPFILSIVHSLTIFLKGMEVAAFLIGKAKSITVVGMERVPFERVLGTEVGGAYQALHSSKGTPPTTPHHTTPHHTTPHHTPHHTTQLRGG